MIKSKMFVGVRKTIQTLTLLWKIWDGGSLFLSIVLIKLNVKWQAICVHTLYIKHHSRQGNEAHDIERDSGLPASGHLYQEYLGCHLKQYLPK